MLALLKSRYLAFVALLTVLLPAQAFAQAAGSADAQAAVAHFDTGIADMRVIALAVIGGLATLAAIVAGGRMVVNRIWGSGR